MRDEKNILKNKVSKKKRLLESFSKSINNFIEVVNSQFEPNELEIFNNNVKTLKIKFKNFSFRNLIEKVNTLAEYDPIFNTIYIGDDSSIWHELFHMLSSFVKDGVLYSGFSKSSFKPKFIKIGYGLNEGYTELLARRYFHSEKHVKSYVIEVYVAEMLEKIIGHQRMRGLYATANLDGLIAELMKYNFEENVIKFICGLDYINDYFKTNEKKREYAPTVVKNIKYVNEFLIRVYATKLKEQLKSNLINNKEFYDLLTEYQSSLLESIEINGVNYEGITVAELQNILRDILENPDLVITKKDNVEENSIKK